MVTPHLHFRPGTSTCCAPGSSGSSILIMTSLTTPSSVPHLWRTETLSSRDPGYKHHRRWVVGSSTTYINIKDPIKLEINLVFYFQWNKSWFLYQLVRCQLKKLVSVLHHQPQCLSQRLSSTKRVCQRPVLLDRVPRDPSGQQELHPRLRGSLWPR